jgi:hypothetical protein
LGAGLQISRPLSLGTHALDCGKHIGLLRQERVAQFGRPLDVARQALHHIRNRDHGLNARIPWLFLHGIRQRFALQRLVPVHPLLQLNDLQRIGGSHQCLAQHRIGIKCDRRDQRIQLIVGNLRHLRRRRGRCGRRYRCLGVLSEGYGRTRAE